MTKEPLPGEVADYLEGLMEGFVVYDAGWRMAYMNAAAEAILGKRREAVLGKTWHEAFPHAVSNPVDRMYERVMRARVPERIELFYQHYGRWFEIGASPVRTGGIAVYFRDTTKRNVAERALRESEERLNVERDKLAAVIGALPVGIAITDARGNTLSMNRAALALHGFRSEEEMLGERGHAAERFALLGLDGEPLAPADCPAARALRGEYVSGWELRLCNVPAGTERIVSYSVVPVRGSAAEVLLLVVVMEDVTQRKRDERALQRANEQLREADRRKDEFLATLAHELRNPLAPIRNAVQILNLRGSREPGMQEARDMIARQVRHMVRLIEDLLDVSRITRGRLELRREPIALGMVLQQALETSRPHLGHELTVSLPAEPIHVYGDAVRLAQVFCNLLNNACHYTAAGGQIWLTVERDNGHAAVKLRDTGIGIAPEHLSRLFEMFSQVAPPLERSRSGLGIGLALARGLVEMHGGSIEARSEGVGRGSEFIVRLPVLAEALSPLQDA